MSKHEDTWQPIGAAAGRIMDRLGGNETPPPSTFKPFTDEELRALYPKPESEEAAA